MLSSKADTEDDFMFDMKPSSASTNPFQGFAPISDPSSGTPLFGGSASDSRAGKMSESPTPDLVQYAHEGELQESSLSKQREDPLVDLVHKGSEAAVDLSDTSKSLPAAPTQESEEPSASPSLPDILNLSPLNPDKEDSGSSEGSPDSERSPVLGPQNPTQSPLNPFNFDSKVLLLKEMAEETEARAAEKRKLEGAQTPEQTFGTFDLVKEAETTTKGKDLHSTMEVEEKDWMFSGKDSGKVADRSEL
ncbi:hypothetical protein AGOR_G00213550 [Albula goreensis]|uniref:Uncharacterized protein n=1 Tax=Albula goreensis TaxID=1534307 RepID=A0A8T3CMS2_9TELE|nr:hypothetical protein AGOR_G00213550 [Albula goreensis]